MFQYHRQILIGDTCVFGSVYFAQFFIFQGEAREEILRQVLEEKVENLDGNEIVTVGAQCLYKKKVKLFDSLKINVQISITDDEQILLDFFMYRNDEKVATGSQTLFFINQLGVKIDIPESFLNKLLMLGYLNAPE